MTELNEALLDERLAALEAQRGWSPRLVSRLEALLRRGTDREVFRINPLSFAADRGLPEAETVDLFLHATAAGLLDMQWMLLCPVCSGVVQSFRRLSSVANHYYCFQCQAGFAANLDDYVAVAFTPRQEIRDTAYHHPETLSARDYCFDYCATHDGLMPDGTAFNVIREAFTRAVAWLPAGEETRIELELEAGLLIAVSPEGGVALVCQVEGAPAEGEQRLELVYEEPLRSYQSFPLRPGHLTLAVRNRRSERGILVALTLPPGVSPSTSPLAFRPFLSGKQLLTSQTFRTLFRTELVGDGNGLGINDIALLFTDLKGSTSLYDRIGDLDAFTLVQRHFARLQEITVRNRGAVIKTIGDAVMAAFPQPLDAVRAALDMRREIATFQPGQVARDLILKIGIHKGAAIAVTLNDRLDYFGQTVNLAARVQHLADADDIFLSEAVYEAPGVREAVAGLAVDTRKAQLRGIAEEQRVYRIAGEVAA